ncbi:MAG TPA: imidazole glycerol phosphate synthase subunit HisH [Clostridia bacterium]|nr:imidazole glycerol phosphate synthase subunit HisH [Clostridia bacterium]
MIAIIDYGMGNLRSVQKAFAYLGLEATITGDARELAAASHLVLPGVGAFPEAMANLANTGLLPGILQSVRDGKPFLGICLGLQLLFETSEEGGCATGLSLLPGEVKRLPVSPLVKVPHMGWNVLRYKDNPIFRGLDEPCFVYYVHSYYVEPACPEHVIGTTVYGRELPVAVHRDNVYGLQFHPEKSGREGLKILGNFAGL